MGAMREAVNRVRSFLHKPERDADLDAEIAAHLEMAIEENLLRGMSEQEARRQALIHFGGVEQAKERQREARGLMTLDILLQDLKYTFRTLGRERGFTTVAVLILALAVGANIAVFSVVGNALRLVANGDRRGDRRFPGSGQRDCRSAVWYGSHRPGNLCGDDAAFGIGGAGGRVSSGTKGFADQPDGGPAQSVRAHFGMRLPAG
jgi:hypothetical protein